MLVCPNHGFVYLDPPKTGSTSVFDFLSQEAFGPIYSQKHETRLPLHTAGFYKFASVRNPFRRMVSLYRHHSLSGEPRFATFLEFLENLSYLTWFYSYSQARLLKDFRLDAVIRTLELENIYHLPPIMAALAQCRTEIRPLPRLNETGDYDFRSYYEDNRCQDLVRSTMLDDFREFKFPLYLP